MEVPNEVIVGMLTVLAGGGGVLGVRRMKNGNGRKGVEGAERRRGQSELISAVREQTRVIERVTLEEGSKTRSGITALAREQAELVGFLRAKL